MNNSKQNKTLVIGLDGAPYPLIKKWSQQGYLPNLARLITRGSFGILNSTIPVHSPTAWASFITGTNPGKHGVFDFVKREEDSYALHVVRADHIFGASLWQLLSQQGYRVGVMNVPMTFPPESVNGFLISGLGTPDYVPYTFPEELSTELDGGGYRVNNKFFFDIDRQDEWLDEIFAQSEKRGQTALDLIQHKSWDFFMTVFRNTDEICHFYWHHMDKSHPKHDPDAPDRYKTAIRDLYQLVDRWVGRLVDAAGDRVNVFIVSDHGAGPLYQDVFLNEWLWQNKLLAMRDETATHSFWSQAARRIGITRKNISDTLTRLNLHRVEVLIKKVLGDRIYVLPRDERPEFMNAIDWSKTRAYSFGYYGQIYLNLVGREPNGIVQPSEYEPLRQRIADGLEKLVDPRDGRPVVDKIYFKEDLYQGPQMKEAPDILAIMRDFAYITRKGYEFAPQRGILFCDPYTNETGSHRPEGVLIAAGPDVAHNATSPKSIQDVAPTLLHLMGCSVPSYMDGESIMEIMTPEFLANRPLQYDEVELPSPRKRDGYWNDEMDAEIVERLQKLGYLG